MRHHLVVIHDRYLDLLIAGRKRIECRLSSQRRPPFAEVEPGDLLWLKLPSRPIRAVATAGRCLFRELRSGSDLAHLIGRHGDAICADGGFFDGAAEWARFASLIWIDTIVVLRPMPVYKADQRAWVPLDQAPFPGMRIDVRRPDITARV